MSPTTTAPPPAPEQTEDRPDAPRTARFSLSATQVTASALAATTATVAASYLGVAGTVIGAAVASVLTVVGNAVYSHSIQRTSDRVRTVVPAAARFAPRGPAPAAPQRAAGRRRGTWQVMTAACVGVFAGVLIVITGVELVAGRPLSDVLQGKSGSGTTLLGDNSAKAHKSSTPTPTTTVTVTPSVVVVTPTVTVTTSPVTKTATASTSPSSSPSQTPSDPASTSGSATSSSSTP